MHSNERFLVLLVLLKSNRFHTWSEVENEYFAIVCLADTVKLKLLITPARNDETEKLRSF